MDVFLCTLNNVRYYEQNNAKNNGRTNKASWNK